MQQLKEALDMSIIYQHVLKLTIDIIKVLLFKQITETDARNINQDQGKLTNINISININIGKH